ncbi:hypothetical protein OX283_009535 [Flavobacterium sp. SUN052]|uniref:hypothetical protein n=1 Tax=Flavobacterium sp. SUN052 TaxID=3002441 RepID=UPI00237D7F4E|nr:hypothetical protein [Flavobacterium sp. SUN052]MEC4004896.1 hypothetical protein [Flavobacterium sp. SUN052]
MKKFFGIVLLIIGLIIVSIGVGGLSYENALRSCTENQIADELLLRSETQTQNGIMVGSAFLFLGIVLFIVGIVLTASKTNKQKRLEIELSFLKENQSQKLN